MSKDNTIFIEIPRWKLENLVVDEELSYHFFDDHFNFVVYVKQDNREPF